MQRNFKITVLNWGKQVGPTFSLNSTDIALLGRSFPHFHGFQLREAIKIRYPDLPVLVVSTKADTEDIVIYIYFGANGSTFPNPLPQNR